MTSSRRMVAAKSGKGERVVKLAHILVAPDQEAVLRDCENKLDGGASFEDLARDHSICSSGKKGGDLGWITRGTFFPQIEKAAFDTPVGGTARATTGRGLHLVKVMAERYQSAVQQVSADELQEILSNPALCEDVQFIDVREQDEWDTARIPGFTLLPLSAASSWASSITTRLDPAKETVVLCHHGVRSMNMAQFLVQQGFSDVRNVTGGIDAYSRVDPSIPRY